LRVAVLCAVGLLSIVGDAAATDLDLSMLQTRDLSLLYFDPAEAYLTPYVARAFENSLAAQRRNFDWTPWQRTSVWLKDFSDRGNAGARVIPTNAVSVEISPMSQIYETFSPGERFFTLMNHEMVHVATMDVWNEKDASWRRFFHGKPMPVQQHPESILYSYLAAPRASVPRWYLEGSAVFMETWMAGGFGRAQGAYDEMVFRAMVRDNAKFYSPLGLESEGTFVDFQVGANDYLYGTRFFSYLALHYSPEKVLEWLRRGKDSDAYYSTQFNHIFGEPLDTAWQNWVAWEHDYQRVNLQSVQTYPLTPTQRLTDRMLGSISRSFYDPTRQSLIGAFHYPGVIAHLGVLSLKDGRIRRLTNLKGPTLYKVTSFAYDPQSNTGWYTINNLAYRDLMQIDISSGKTKLLLKGARIGDLVFNPQDRSIWGVRHLNGYVTLVRIPPPYTGWNQVHTFDYGEIVFDLDISRDGQFLSASVGQINGDQTERVFRLSDLLSGNATEVTKFQLGSSMPEGFVFSPDGRFLYGNAYYTGVSNIYRFEIATGNVEAVSNVSTGLFRPIPRDDGSLIAFEYTGQGFTPVVIDPKPLDDLGAITFLGTKVANERPFVKTLAVGSPAQVPLDDMITARGKYVPWQQMQLDSAYPVLQGYKGRVAYGWQATFEDPLLLNQLSASASYLPDAPSNAERWHANVDYRMIDWHFVYWHNYADFYDLLGPIDRARKGDAILAEYNHTLIYDEPRTLDLIANTNYYRGLDTLPGAQNVHTTGLDSNLVQGNVGLKYSYAEKSLGAVDHEEGYEWNVMATEDYAQNEDQSFPKLRGGFNFGFALPWKHSSLWMYNSAGVAGGNQSNPLAYYYFGSFENNYIDDREVKRYRQYDSFPGFEIDQIAARSFAKSVLEWNLPPIRFEEVGSASFFLSSARTALFTGVMFDDSGTGPNHTLSDVGIQMDWNFTVALRLPMTFSIGYAAGFEGGVVQRNEFMISLRIL
jgi:hypothetical protein